MDKSYVPSSHNPQHPLLQAKDIHMDFNFSDEKVSILRSVNFTITDNSFNIIYGASGSGKSTLLNILTGLQKPTKGTLDVEGRSLYDYTPDELARFRAHRIGIVYQQNYWVHSLNVIENISLPLYFLGYSRAEASSLALISLERVDMVGYAKKYPTMLSGGEQQRIAMARALVNDPRIIIADEPTGSLDSKNGDKIMGLLSKIKNEYRRTIILVTHNMEYLPLANYLLHIQDGNVQELKSGSIRAATNELMRDMKQRIDRLSGVNKTEETKK